MSLVVQSSQMEILTSSVTPSNLLRHPHPLPVASLLKMVSGDTGGGLGGWNVLYTTPMVTKNGWGLQIRCLLTSLASGRMALVPLFAD